ncbi:MAG: hypothetical protein ACLP1X_01805 [Polyangiaceae bacterium]
MKPAALVPLVAFALGACGDEEWSFEVAADDAGDAGARSDALDGGGCTSDSDCKPSNLHCDTTSGQCVACVTDSQCTQPGLYRCASMLDPPRCVQCGVDADCGMGKACQPATHQCVAACTSDQMCPESTSHCTHGLCVGCVDDGDCYTGSGGPMESCDLTIGECVQYQCTSDLECPPMSVCDTNADRCVGCLTNVDCPRNWVCNTNDHVCIEPMDAGGAADSR